MMRTGVYRGVDIDTYHASPALSKSGLDLIAQCPAVWWAKHRDPMRPKEKPRDPHGTLAHCATLEPETFSERYVIAPDLNKNSNAWKDWLADLPAGKTAISAAQRRTAFMQAESARAVPEFAEALLSGRPEESACWIDLATGVLCRCRPDWVYDLGEPGVILFDLKTFESADPRQFGRQVPRMSYHVQDAWYSDGYALASGRTVLGFVFIVVESDYPHLASAIALDADAREQGRREYRRALDTFAECDRSDTWPGYATGMHTITLPRYALETE